MASDTDRPAVAALDDARVPDVEGKAPPAPEPAEPVESVDVEPAPDAPDPADVRLTRRVHVVLGLLIAAIGAWLLYRSLTELAFKGGNGEPGPGYLPVILTIGLIGLGLALSAVWLWGPRARTGDVPTLSLSRAGMSRAGLAWFALVICIAPGHRRNRTHPFDPLDSGTHLGAARDVRALRDSARGATPGRNPVAVNGLGTSLPAGADK
jgi:hypothetical protein